MSSTRAVDSLRKSGLESVYGLKGGIAAWKEASLPLVLAEMPADLVNEVVVVDNGSTDGTAEFLEKQADVRLIKNLENLGAPKARNQGIEAASGDQLVFMDNDVMVSPGWLGRMLYHLHASPVSGCVGCLSDRAAQDQQLAYPGDSSLESITVFADERAGTHRRGDWWRIPYLLP